MGTNISSVYRETVLESNGDLDFGEFELQLFDGRYMNNKNSLPPSVLSADQEKYDSCLRPSCIPVSILLILISLIVLFPLLDNGKFLPIRAANDEDDVITPEPLLPANTCNDDCFASLAESIPENLTFAANSPTHISTFNSWNILLDLAEREIKIASFYWTLLGSDVVNDSSAWQGEAIFNRLMDAGIRRNISIKIVQSQPSRTSPNNDTAELVKAGAAEVRTLDFERLMGAGVLHTKFWIVDGRHFYVGSANMDFRALTQVKEMGAVITSCPCMASDLNKIFDVYWTLGQPNATIPPKWPDDLATNINHKDPAKITLNGTLAPTFISSSPPPFSPFGRDQDIDAIVRLIDGAERYVYVAVMDYYAQSLYGKQVSFWPVLDNALRRAAIERKVEVRLMVSQWNSTRAMLHAYAMSFVALSRFNTRVKAKAKKFIVPPLTDRTIPYSRVNHNKYMVTDKAAYIGTSNWSKDYFTNTAGVGLIITDPAAAESETSHSNNLTIRQQLTAVFERDWNSNYTTAYY